MRKIIFILKDIQIAWKNIIWKACNGEIGKDQLVEAYSKVALEKVTQMEAIVFADDIVATGVTLKGTIQGLF